MHAWASRAALFGLALALPVAGAQAQAQGATITGKVTSEFGQPIDQANVYITEINISVGTNAQGVYTITLPAARATGTAANLRVRAIGYQPGNSSDSAYRRESDAGLLAQAGRQPTK